MYRWDLGGGTTIRIEVVISGEVARVDSRGHATVGNEWGSGGIGLARRALGEALRKLDKMHEEQEKSRGSLDVGQSVERLNERGSSVSGERSVLTVKEVAEFLGISKSTCYDLIRRGEIKSISIGKSKRVLRAELLRWLESIQE